MLGSFRFSVLCLFVAGLMTACATTEPVQDKAAQAVSQAVPDQPLNWAAVRDRTGEVKVGWIQAFSDPVLVKLVAEAQKNNRNLQAAAANVEASRGLAKQAGAALKPNVNLSATGGRGGAVEGGGSNSFNVGLQTSWELDVWGRIRSGEQAAVASFAAAQADYRASQHSVAAGVARSYFVAIEAQLQEAVANSILESVTKTQRVVNSQFQNGLASAQDVALVKADLASARDSLTAAQAGKRDALRALELLLGRYPAADISVRNTLPALPAPPGVGLPAEVLERRPDLIAAERRVAAAMGAVDVAKAARLPQISLTGSLGGSSNQLSNLLNPTNLAWQAASSLLAPLFDGGARAAQVEVSTADQKAAVAAYAQSALTAFGEVETALDQRVTLEKRVVSLTEAYSQSDKALNLAQLRFKEGEGDLIDVLTVQQRVDGAQSTLLSIRRAQLQQFVDLNLALGGDWR